MGECCLNILIKFSGREYNISLVKELDLDGSLVRYNFDDPVNGIDVALEYREDLGKWVIEDVDADEVIFIAGDDVPLDCPISSSDDWVFDADPESYTEYSFVIYEVQCMVLDNNIPDPYPVEESDFNYCTNSTLFKKQKGRLSKDIAAISKREVFGFDCGGEWENLFMRSLIIDALSCPPYGVISKDTERCLIGKLNEKCNC